MREKRARLKADGRCTVCQQPHGYGPDAKKWRCDDCNAEVTAKNWQKVVNLTCVSCNKPVKMNGKRIHRFCEEHLLKRRVWRRDYRIKNPDKPTPIVRGASINAAMGEWDQELWDSR
jgi:hypothetical protein